MSVSSSVRPKIGQRGDRVTISQLADVLGLTKGTVSRALNGYTDISASTQHRVRRMADELGYRPLSHAQAIRTGRVRSLGLVLTMSEHDGHRPFLADFLAGATQAVSAEGWTLTVATAPGEDETLSTLKRLVEERKADGFIIPRTRTRDTRIDMLREAGVPFVLYGRTGDPQGCAWFDIEGETAMAKAVQRLARFGHRQIAYLGGAEGHAYADLRLQGYKAGLVAAGLTERADYIVRGAMTRTQGAAFAAKMLSLPAPPTAFVCALDLAALGVYAAVRNLGLKVGRDVSVIGYDGVPEGEIAAPPLTTFAVDTRAAGARLAAMLIDRIRGVAPEDLRETVEARLVPRGSDGPRL